MHRRLTEEAARQGMSLAEATGATLLTRDGRLGRAIGHRARIELV
jgi:predicted nucleic acid-binding protein